MIIDDRTKIPLFVAIAAVPVLVVAVFWIATLSGRVTATEQRTDRVVDKIRAMETKEDKILDGISDVRERLARIEEQLKRSR